MALLNSDVRIKSRRSRATAILLTLATANLSWPQAQAQGSLEYEVKAAYLVKFAPFIAWPDGAFASPSSPLTICVVGTDPFGEILDHAAAGEHDGERSLTVRHLATPEAGCQILFAGGDDEAVKAVLKEEKDQPVVTVTDSGIASHGIISFTVVDDHVRFDIDEAAADAVSIHISSKLLELAHAVRKEGQP